MKKNKLNLPNEITIEIEDAKFIFNIPSYLDQIDYPDAYRGKADDENPIKHFSYKVHYAMAKLKRIEGVTFEEDNTPVGVASFKDFEPDVIMQVTLGYLEKVTEYLAKGSSIKKDQEPTES